MTRLTQRPFIALFIPILFAIFSLTVYAQSDLPDYASYQVIDRLEFEDLYAAPGISAAYLDPSGERFVHIADERVCVYDRLESAWTQRRCLTVDRRFLSNPVDAAISPDGAWLALPTFERAFFQYRDSDLRLLNLESGRSVALTEDGYDGGLFDLPRDSTVHVDTASVWLSDRQLAFVRMSPDPASKTEQVSLLPSAIYLLDIAEDGTPSEPRLLATSPTPTPFSIYVLAANTTGGQLAFVVDTGNREPDIQGIWQVDVETGALRQLAAAARMENLPRGLAYSADGRYLLALYALPMIDPNAPAPVARVLDLETGEFIDIAPSLGNRAYVSSAGWAPSGSALVYTLRGLAAPDMTGVYIAAQPGEPGRMILEGQFFATTAYMTTPINWGASDIILVGRGAQPGILLIQVG